MAGDRDCTPRQGTLGLSGWDEDAQTAMENGKSYFEWWDRVKTGVLVGGVIAVVLAYRANEESKR